MTTTHIQTKPQVFLSFGKSDQAMAHRIAKTLRESGLRVVGIDELRAGGAYTEIIREALHESDAMVVVLSHISPRQELPASVLFEIGAATGAEKPIYVVVEEPTTKLPFVASQVTILPINRVEEIVDKLSSK